MTEKLPETISSIGVAAWAGGSISAWVTDNIALITALCMIGGLLVNAIGVLWRMRMDKKRFDREVGRTFK